MWTALGGEEEAAVSGQEGQRIPHPHGGGRLLPRQGLSRNRRRQPQPPAQERPREHYSAVHLIFLIRL